MVSASAVSAVSVIAEAKLTVSVPPFVWMSSVEKFAVGTVTVVPFTCVAPMLAVMPLGSVN